MLECKLGHVLSPSIIELALGSIREVKRSRTEDESERKKLQIESSLGDLEVARSLSGASPSLL